MSGRRRAGGVGTQRDVIKIRRYVWAQSSFENGVTMPRTQGMEKRHRKDTDVAPAPQTQDKFLLMHALTERNQYYNQEDWTHEGARYLVAFWGDRFR